MNLKSLAVMAGVSVIGIFSGGIFDKAAAIELNFNDPVQSNDLTSAQLSNLGAGYSGTTIDYRNVSAGVDVRVTAMVTGSDYSFVGNLPNFATTQPNSTNTGSASNGDAAFLYKIGPNQTGMGSMTYKFDFFSTDGTTHDFTTAYTAANLKFLIYDVDGEASQSESVEIAKGGGFTGYQVGDSGAALTASDTGSSYLFEGVGTNQNERDSDGAAIFYFENTNSVSFKFNANTTTATTNTNGNGVFSGIDGDLSLLPNIQGNFGSLVSVNAPGSSTAVPEPFTIIGSIIGGTAAFRMRKKLKSTDKA
jgi:hypothetical protein